MLRNKKGSHTLQLPSQPSLNEKSIFLLFFMGVRVRTFYQIFLKQKIFLKWVLMHFFYKVFLRQCISKKHFETFSEQL